MDIHVKYNSKNVKDLKVDIDGFKEEVDLSNHEDLFFNVRAIVMSVIDGLVNEIAKSAPPDKKKELAGVILDDVKTVIGMYYDDMDKAYHERDPLIDMYDDMEKWYEYVLGKYDINEEKLLELATENDCTLDAELSDDRYIFKIEIVNEIYTIGEVSSFEEDKVIEVEAFRASMFIIILYDKVYSDDTNENPFRQSGMFNPFAEVLSRKFDISF